MSEPVLILYAVRNQQGHFFRSKGYNGGGKTWVENIGSAKIYAKRGPARAVVTFFSKNPEKYGVPDLVELRVTEIFADPEEQVRALKAVSKIQENILRQEAWRRECDLDIAKKNLAEAQKRLDELQKNKK